MCLYLGLRARDGITTLQIITRFSFKTTQAKVFISFFFGKGTSLIIETFKCLVDRIALDKLQSVMQARTPTSRRV